MKEIKLFDTLGSTLGYFRALSLVHLFSHRFEMLKIMDTIEFKIWFGEEIEVFSKIVRNINS